MMIETSLGAGNYSKDVVLTNWRKAINGLLVENDIDMDCLVYISNSPYANKFLDYFDYLMEKLVIDHLKQFNDTAFQWKEVEDWFTSKQSLARVIYVDVFGKSEKEYNKFALKLFVYLETSLPANFESILLDQMKQALKGSIDPISFINSMKQLGLGYKIEENMLMAFDCIFKDYISEYSESLEEELLGNIQTWFEVDIFPRLCRVSLDTVITKTAEKHLYKEFCKFRIDQMFDIIVDYPASNPAINDLKVSMGKCLNLDDYLINETLKSLKKRLLQPGAKTTDIIHLYISTVSVFSILDPRGYLVQTVTEPIRDYLKLRDDTVRSIIHRLFNDETLGNDLKRSELISIADEYETEDEWEPVPKSLSISKSLRNKDILSCLVSIYDSKDVFVNEFQIYLSHRLLNVSDYQYDDEVRHVELLKIRFGDCLHNCEVMLKDILESKRLDTTIHVSSQTKIHSLILSHLFWPKMTAKKIKYPAVMEAMINSYEREYESIKRARKLTWFPDLGTVDVDLSMPDGRDLSFTVSPIHAAVIHLFEKRDHWTLAQGANELGITQDQFKPRAMFWVANKVLKLSEDNENTVLSLCDIGAEKLTNDHAAFFDIHGEEDQQSRQDEEMMLYWNFIYGMLTNLGALPADRIHMMLSMFVQAPNKFEHTLDHLRQFLDSMVVNDKLEMVAGSYKLKQ